MDPQYNMACDDVDPESQCSFSAQGSSVDEVYQKMIAHGKDAHPDKMNSLSAEELVALEKEMREFMEKQQRAGQPAYEKGLIGYVILWLLGVPATILFVIFLLRGCD